MLKFAIYITVLLQTLYANNIEDDKLTTEYYFTNHYDKISTHLTSNNSDGNKNEKKCIYENDTLQSTKAYIFKYMKYRIVNYPIDLNEKEVQIALKKTFSFWTNATGIVFRKSVSKFPSITITFDDNSKNGTKFGKNDYISYSIKRNVILKRHYIHFNKKVNWSLNKDDEAYLPRFAAHAIGHCLGLKHSEDHSSIMYPYFNKQHYDIQFSNSDKEEINELYQRSITLRYLLCNYTLLRYIATFYCV